MFDKLKRLFVVSDEEFKKKVGDADLPSTDGQATDQVPKSKPSEVKLEAPRPISGQADSKFIEILLNAIEKNNQDGFDYLEFKQALQNLGTINMDEATRYSSAVAMAKTMGATPQSLIDSANTYLQVLKIEEDKFNKALLSQNQKIEEDRTSGVDLIKSSILEKEKQIATLQEQIAKDKVKLESMKQEIEQSSQKIQETNDQFHHAYTNLVEQIVTDMEKISKVKG